MTVNQLGVFAKYWQPGAVKTRLAASIGPEAASRLYRCFVRAIVLRFAATADRRILCYSPAEHRNAFVQLAEGSWDVIDQGEGDLGERISRFFAIPNGPGVPENSSKRVLIGSDSPNLPIDLITQSFAHLDSHRVVLGPSSDGGYYLVGVRGQPPDGLFHEIDWSTDRVWAQTVTLLRDANIDFAELPEWYDIDEYPDLVRLGEDLARQQSLDQGLIELQLELQKVQRDEGQRR